MPTHSETRILPYSAQQMYDLVADVAKYPQFLPWCAAARVRSVTQQPDGSSLPVRNQCWLHVEHPYAEFEMRFGLLS